MGFFLLSFALAAEPPPVGRDIEIPAPSAPAEGANEPAPVPEEGGAAPAETAAVEEAPPVDAPAAAPPGVTYGEALPEEESLSLDERRSEGAGRYLLALEAWRAGRYSRAWRLASEALTLDPDLTPARLLAGYALLRMRRTEEAEGTLAGLVLEPGASPLPPERRREAERLLRRQIAPRQRDQWAVSVGNVMFVQRMGDMAVPLNGYVFAARAPLRERLAVRIDGGAPWGGTASELDIRGPRFGLYAVTAQPLGPGVLHVDLAAGPAFWIAEGRYWADGWEPYVGARAAVGLDLRIGAAIGLRYEMGASVFPMAADDLAFYAEPLDFRIALETWFGR